MKVLVFLLLSAIAILVQSRGFDSGRAYVASDFEDGTLGVWNEQSATVSVKWVVETKGSQVSWSIPTPPPPSGEKYIRTLRRENDPFAATAALRSRAFVAEPGDQVYLDFWIHSYHIRGNSLLVFWLQNGEEKLLIDLTTYSTPTNTRWRNATAPIPISVSTITHLAIYGYCGAFYEDAIAVDNIIISNPANVGSTTPIVLTTEATTTTTEPTTTPTTTTPTTTLPPIRIVYPFTKSTDRWTLGNNNGARWVRVGQGSNILPPAPGIPSGDSEYLAVQHTGIYTGITLAESPVYRIVPGYIPHLYITFWINGTQTIPASLVISRKPDGPYYPDSPFLNLGVFGNRPNSNWFSISTTIPSGSEPFQLLLEGYTGQDKNNAIAVGHIEVTGVEEIPRNLPIIWNIENNTLEGWTMGYCEGSRWVVASESGGNLFLTVVTSVSRPGMTTLESPILDPSLNARRVSIRFRVKGTSSTPAELTIRKRTADGILDPYPFIDLRPYGASDNSQWIDFSGDLPPSNVPYQVIVEGFPGANANNLIAVDDVVLDTLNTQGGVVKSQSLFGKLKK